MSHLKVCVPGDVPTQVDRPKVLAPAIDAELTRSGSQTFRNEPRPCPG